VPLRRRFILKNKVLFICIPHFRSSITPQYVFFGAIDKRAIPLLTEHFSIASAHAFTSRASPVKGRDELAPLALDRLRWRDKPFCLYEGMG
jgi:hypothetical protein